MAEITFKGNKANINGVLPKEGSKLTDFALVAIDLTEKTKADFNGKRIVLNIFPSIDTGVCQASVRKFNEKASDFNNTVVVNVSKDLPFAMSRFCASEGLNNVQNLSDFRSNFGEELGVLLIDTPLKGLLARAVLVVDTDGTILYSELVSEIGNEPNYEKALSVL